MASYNASAVACGSLIIAAICSMLSNSEAKWEAFQEQQAKIIEQSSAPAALESQHQSKGFKRCHILCFL
ncbi:hypothetical protein KSX_51210 [Ktedonospora formicarum]|uniref:Uncharacterized protein n=1 Tax=Ktedonospora formicarum TaxID=2778364 RepID=A0A8J3I4L0_9CHLR|nr:hypothetical protein KSX_51210 [Ktedonospora formicarum]